MCPQLSYSINTPAWSYPGQLADNMQVRDFLSMLAVVAALPYGRCVIRDATNTLGFDQLACKLPASAADINTPGSVCGIVAADQARAQDPSVAVATYPINSAVPVLKAGRIVVLSETAVVDGQPAYVRHTANGGLNKIGGFRADSDGGTAERMPNAIWIGDTSAAGFAVVQILEA